jgi:hypothetical protein
METIKLKIQDFDSNNISILVSVASDETNSNNPDDYDAVSYSPITMWPDETDTNKILRNLAYANLYNAEQQKMKENLSDSDPRIQWLESIKGKTFEFNVEELKQSFME